MNTSYNALSPFVPVLRATGPKKLLHVGCGNAPPSRLPQCFKRADWQEVRLDIDPKVYPDIVADITDLSILEPSSIDAVWSSHNLEHLDDYNVAKALAEIRRVLKPGGFALITLPDLQYIAQLVAEDRADEVMYVSPAGPITPLDMLFGHQASQQRGNSHMAHRTGFSAKRLGRKLTEAGFDDVRITRGKSYDLWAVAVVHG